MKFRITILIVLVIVKLSTGEEHPHGRQIQILSADGGENYNHEALNEILLHPEVEDRKIVLLSIIGAYRKGKSFFLDYCLRFLYANYKSINKNYISRKKSNWWGKPNEPLTGFSWKHGSKADTKGILFWNDAFLYEKNGEKIAIFLMDTQGLFELGGSQNFDAKIFGITSFLSSIEILNMQTVIQENQLEYLKMATDFSKVVQQQSDALTPSSKPFQELMFLVRDFIDDKIGYGYEGGRKYFNSVFDGHTANKAAQNVRTGIVNSFDRLHTVTLPYPGTGVTKSSYNGSWSTLDDEFMTHLKTLIPSLLSPNKLVKKKILGNEVTGKELAKYAESLFKAFQSPDLPKVESILDVFVKVQMEKIIEKLIEEYKDEMKSKLNYNDESFLVTLNRNHKTLQNSIIRKYKQAPKIADSDLAKFYEKEIRTRTNEFFEEWKQNKFEHYNEMNKLKGLKDELLESRRMMKKLVRQFELEINIMRSDMRRKQKEKEDLDRKIAGLLTQISELEG